MRGFWSGAIPLQAAVDHSGFLATRPVQKEPPPVTGTGGGVKDFIGQAAYWRGVTAR